MRVSWAHPGCGGYGSHTPPRLCACLARSKGLAGMGVVEVNQVQALALPQTGSIGGNDAKYLSDDLIANPIEDVRAA